MALDNMIGGIVSAFRSAKPILLSLGIAVVVYLVLLIVVGIFVNLISAGTIAVPTAVNTSANTLLTTMTTIGTVVFTALTVVGGFIVIAVVLALFGPMLGLNFGGSKSSRRKRY